MKVFTETQRFNQWWLIVLEIFIIIIISFDLYIKISEFNSGNSDSSITSIIISLIIILAVFILLFSMKLTMRIDETGISYKFFPLHLKSKKVVWQELSKAFVRKYNPLIEYGGWGIRGFRRKGGLRGNGMAYNIKGNMGIQLEFIDGGKLLLGTQLTEKAKQTLQNYQYKMESNS